MPQSEKSLGVFSNMGKIVGGYASLWSVFVAALPVSASLLRAIPIYETQRGYFGLYTSVACFLLLGYSLYARDQLAKGMKFPWTNRWTLLLPLFLMLCSFACVIAYHATLTTSVAEVIDQAHRNGTNLPVEFRNLLAMTDERAIPDSLWLFSLYLGIFIFAEATFIIFVIKEYIQQALGVSEWHLLSTESSNSQKDNISSDLAKT